MDYFKPIIDHCRGPDKGISLHGRRKKNYESIIVSDLSKRRQP
jgi:hypothetical protein